LQTSQIAGTLFQGIHLSQNIWFLAIYLISQAKTGLSAIDLKWQLGVIYSTGLADSAEADAGKGRTGCQVCAA
jgi:hypothetical protein